MRLCGFSGSSVSTSTTYRYPFVSTAIGPWLPAVNSSIPPPVVGLTIDNRFPFAS